MAWQQPHIRGLGCPLNSWHTWSHSQEKAFESWKKNRFQMVSFTKLIPCHGEVLKDRWDPSLSLPPWSTRSTQVAGPSLGHTWPCHCQCPKLSQGVEQGPALPCGAGRTHIISKDIFIFKPPVATAVPCIASSLCSGFSPWQVSCSSCGCRRFLHKEGALLKQEAALSVLLPRAARAGSLQAGTPSLSPHGAGVWVP